MENVTLNANSHTPLYQQLYDVIKEQIQAAELSPGEKIPSELQLSKIYNVSRITVRKAMELLTEDNFIIKRSGKGMFVSPSKIQENLLGNQSFTLTCQINNISQKIMVIKQEIRQASRFDTESLYLSPSDRIAYIKRLRYAGDTPIMIENIHLKYDLFSYILEEDLSRHSLYELVSLQFPEESRKIHRSLEISTATAEQAKQLQLPNSAPLLLCHEIVTTKQGLPLFCIRQFIAGERVRFTTMD